MVGTSRIGIVCVLASMIMTTSVSAGESLVAGGTGAANGVASRLASGFLKGNPGSAFEIVPSMGSGGGIKAAAAGVIDIAFSARPLKFAEKVKGVKQLSLLDTPYVFVTSGSTASGLASQDIVSIYALEKATFPDGRPLRLVLRPKSDSDTEFLIEHFSGMAAAQEVARRRTDIPIAATDQDNLAMAEQVKDSFTGSTLLQIVTEESPLRVLPLDGVQPTAESLTSGRYPLSKRIYVVVRESPSPLVQRFLDFVKSEAGAKILLESGSVPAG